MIKLKDLYPNQASFMKEENINEAPDNELFKKLRKHQDEIYKLLQRYKSKANVPAIARSFMLGLNNQLKKDKMIEFTSKGREIDKVYGDFEVLLRDFEKEFISLSAQAGRVNDNKADERILLKTLKKHIIPLYSMVRSWNRTSKRD